MEAQFFAPHKIIGKIKALSQDIFHTLPPKTSLVKNNIIHLRWNPPSIGFQELNIDGSAKGNLDMASAGGLIRDHRGAWIGSFNRAISYTHLMTTELWDLRDGLTLARNLDIKKLLIEIDA